MLKHLLLFAIATVTVSPRAQAGSESFTRSDKGGTEISAPAIRWYADNEFNLSLWGAYDFTGNQYSNDRYFNADHAWGGGIDAKYFFHRYFGVGLQGSLVKATFAKTFIEFFAGRTSTPTIEEDRTIGSALATFTIRYPIGTSRFAPYVFVGGGAMFGGGEHLDSIVLESLGLPPGTSNIRTQISGTNTQAVGQFGGGLEVRLTKHIGLMTDFSWNLINGRDNNLGTIRTGLTFAF